MTSKYFVYSLTLTVLTALVGYGFGKAVALFSPRGEAAEN